MASRLFCGLLRDIEAELEAATTELGLAPMGELLMTVEQGWDLVGRFESKWCLEAWELSSPRVRVVPEP